MNEVVLVVDLSGLLAFIAVRFGYALGKETGKNGKDKDYRA